MQPFHSHTQMPTEHESRHPAGRAVRKSPSFQVCFDNIKNVTISPPQNTHCKNVLGEKKKVQAKMIQGSKKKSCPAPPELFHKCFLL